MLSFEPNTSAPPVSAERLKIVQENLGVEFPPEFVQMLRASNGGVPRARFLDALGEERELERFLSIVDEYKVQPLGCYDIEVVWSQIEDRLDEGVLPFAAFVNGDFLCFGFSEGKSSPSVLLWQHEEPGEVAPMVASSFAELARMLHA